MEMELGAGGNGNGAGRNYGIIKAKEKNQTHVIKICT